jgi:cytochrome c-type biogenesis protein CcmH/NrfG
VSRLADRLAGLDRDRPRPAVAVGEVPRFTAPPAARAFWRRPGLLVIVVCMAATPLAMVVGSSRSMQPTAGSRKSLVSDVVSPAAGTAHLTRLEDDRRLGLRAAADGSLEEAARLLTRVVARDAADAQAWNALGVTLIRQGDLPAGARALTRAVSADPRLAEAHLNLAVALDRQGKRGEATQHYRSFLDRADSPHPRRDQARQRLAEIERGGPGR